MEGSRTLVIFDFDCTIAEVDSDPWVAQELGAMALMDELRTRMPWNDMMDALMKALHADGKTIAEVEDALRSIPLEPEKIAAIKHAHAHGCELRIVSDANYFFIKTILDKYKIFHLFTAIHTNPASVDATGRLYIQPFHPKAEAPHGCPLCPPNMCKGRILNDILSQMGEHKKRIIYVGDGCGDYCPTSSLKDGDCILAREGYPLLDLLTQNLHNIKASVYPWATAQIMQDTLATLIDVMPVKLQEENGFGTLGDENCAKCALLPLEQVKEGRKPVYA